MDYIKIKLTPVRARCWSGYTKNKTGWLPRRMSWMEPGAAKDFLTMNTACDNVMEYTDVYRSPMTQVRAIANATAKKRRLYAPPTKSGHNFGFSIDVSIQNTLKNFRASENSAIVAAGKNIDTLREWMEQFGWTPISSEQWHFNHLEHWPGTVAKINEKYYDIMHPDNKGVQLALNALVDSNLEIDGILGKNSSAAAARADMILHTNDHGAFSANFRRVLAGSIMVIEEV